MALQVFRTVSPWYPSREADLNRQFNQLVQAVLGPAGTAPQPQRPWQPHTEVSETEAGYVVEVELPGLARDAVQVEVEANRLRISGEYATEDGEDEGRRLGSRRSGSFEYRATLPRGVDAGAITADLADGVLTVTVPKPVTPEPRRVEITAG